MTKPLLAAALIALSTAASAQTVTLRSAQTRYLLGQNVLLDFVVKNDTDKPLTLDVGGDYRGGTRFGRFKVEAYDASGHPLEDPTPYEQNFGGFSTRPSLKPGESYVATLALARYRRIPGPGHYRVVASHDLGWTHPGRAEIELDFDRPDAAQAAAVVAEQCALAPAESFTFGKPTRPYRDLKTLGYAEYLAPLLRIEPALALEGIGQIRTSKSTDALLRLGAELPGPVADQLALRLQLPLTGAQREATLALARPLLPSRTACTLFMAFGSAADLPGLLDALDRELVPVSTYPRPAGPAHDLQQTVMQLADGVDLKPTTSARRLVLLLRSDALAASALADRSALVREQAVLKLPQEFHTQLVKLLDDPDLGVQVAACGKLPGEARVLEKVTTAEDEWVLRAAVNASGSHRWDCAERLARRLPEQRLWQTIVPQLMGVTIGHISGYSSDGDPSLAELKRLQRVWLAFLAAHRAEMEAGKGFKSLPRELRPRNMTMHGFSV